MAFFVKGGQMIGFDERVRQLGRLREAGRHGEALALLQQLFFQAARLDVPARRSLFMVMLEWQFLIEVFAPARAALAEARDAQVAQLLDGDLYFDRGGAPGEEIPEYQRLARYTLVVEINEILKDASATRDLFVRLEAVQPGLARRRAWRALPAIVEMGDFALADRYRGEPLVMLAPVNDSAAHLPLLPPGRKAPRLAGELVNLTRDVRIAVAVLRGLGRSGEADALRESLLAGLASAELREVAGRELDAPGTIKRMIVDHQMALEGSPVAPS